MYRPEYFTPRPAFYRAPESNQHAIVAYWAGVLSKPGNHFPSQQVNLRISYSGILNPVLVDIASGELTAVSGKEGTTDTLDHLPLRDSVTAIADRSYFAWPELSEAVSDTLGRVNPRKERNCHGRASDGSARSMAIRGETSRQRYFVLGQYSHEQKSISYRVRVGNSAGISAFSNIANAPE